MTLAQILDAAALGDSPPPDGSTTGRPTDTIDLLTAGAEALLIASVT